MTSKCNALHLNQVLLLEVKTFLGVLFILSFFISSFDPEWNPHYFLLLMGKPWRHLWSGADSRNDHLIILSFLWYWENEYWPKSSHGLSGGRRCTVKTQGGKCHSRDVWNSFRMSRKKCLETLRRIFHKEKVWWFTFDKNIKILLEVWKFFVQCQIRCWWFGLH